MSDLAHLGLVIESDCVQTADNRLDGFTESAGRAERATDALAGASARANSATGQLGQGARGATSAVRDMANAIAQQEAAELAAYRATQQLSGGVVSLSAALGQADAHMQAYRKATAGVATGLGDFDSHIIAHRQHLAGIQAGYRLTAREGLNMSRQVSDIGVSMAMGMNPFMIAIQQGPQIFDTFQEAALRAGTTIRTAMVATGVAVWTALAPLLPVILAIAAAAGALAIGWGLATRSLTSDIGDVASKMNLTEEQMERLKEKGVSTTATSGDAFKALGTTIKEMFRETFGPQLDWISERWNSFLDGATRFALQAVKFIGGAFVGAYYAIRDTWRMWPGALSDIAVTAVNAAVRAIEYLGNKGREIVNNLILGAQAMARINPAMSWAYLLKPIEEFSIRPFANEWAGQAEAAGRQIASSFNRGMADFGGGIDAFGDRWAANTRATAEARIADAAGDPPAARDARKVREELERIVITAPRARAALQDFGLDVPELVDPLRLIADELALIDGLVRDAGRGMEEAFGRAGGALAALMEVQSGFAAQQAAINLAEKEHRLDEGQAARERAALEVRTYGDMAKAAKGFFGERTAGYKAMQVAEQAFRAIEFAMAVKSVAMAAWETASKIPHYLAEAAAATAAGGAKMFSQLGVWAFPAVAAMVAVMAGLGSRGGGGGGTYTPPAANTGTGTVLGDGSAESESLSRGLDMTERYQRDDLLMSRGMLDALQSIDSGIGAVTTAIAKSFEVSGGLSADGLDLGTTTTSSLFGLLSTTRSSQLVGSGLDLNGGALATLIANGVSGWLVRIIENTKTKSGFLGIGGKTVTWTEETRSPIDAALSRELGQLLASLRSGVLTAAQTLGLEGAEAVLDALQINLGRIDFTGLSSSEISQRLNAVFSAVGDQMAAALLPQIEQFQQAGEGLFETLVRLATQVQAVDGGLSSIGMRLQATGIEGIAARDRLVQLTGGLDAFLDQVDFFATNFLTDAQRIAPVQAAVTAELARLGLASDLTREQFASTVLGLDLSTEAGAAMYAALMRLAPAFDTVASHAEDTAARMEEEARRAADAAARVLTQRRSLEITLMDAMGDSTGALAARRADELAAMDESLRALQLQVWAAQDAAAAQAELARQQEAAAQAAEQYRQTLLQQVEDARGRLSAAYEREAGAIQGVIDKFAGLAAGLRAYRDTLGNEMPGAGSYEAARAAFNRTSALAKQGDEAALGALQGTAEAYLTAARNNAGSAEAYAFEVARVRRSVTGAIGAAEAQQSVAQQQLDRLKDQVRYLIDLNENVLTVADAIRALHDAMRAAGMTPVEPLAMAAPSEAARSANDNGADMVAELRALRQEVAALREDQRAGHGAIATNTGKAARILDRVAPDGDALVTTAA